MKHDEKGMGNVMKTYGNDDEMDIKGMIRVMKKRFFWTQMGDAMNDFLGAFQDLWQAPLKLSTRRHEEKGSTFKHAACLFGRQEGETS